MGLSQLQKNLYLLGKDKDIIIDAFTENEDIVSLLMPTYNPNTATKDLDILLQDHIYDTVEIDNTQGESKTYICIETFVPNIESDTIKEIGIVINVFCHYSLKSLSSKEKSKYVLKGYYGNRIDTLIDAIDRCLNGKSGLGIGRLRLKQSRPINILKPVNNYYGKSMEYIVSDFNVVHKI